MKLGEKHLADGITVPIYEPGDLDNSNRQIALPEGIGAFPLVEPGDPRGSGYYCEMPSGTKEFAERLFLANYVVALHGGGTDEWEWYDQNASSTDSGFIDHKTPTARDYGSYIEDIVISPLDGSILFAQEDYTYKVDKDGNEVWITKDKDDAPAAQIATGRNGEVVVARGAYNTENYLVCYDADGNKQWDRHPPESCSGVVISPDNRLFMTVSGRGLFELDIKTGDSLWANRDIPSDSFGGLALTWDAGNMFINIADASDSRVYRVDDAGSYDVTLTTPYKTGGIRAAPGGRLVGSEYVDEDLYCIDFGGTTQWENAPSSGYTPPGFAISPASDGSHRVTVGSWSGLEWFDLDTGSQTYYEDNGIHDAVAGEWGLYSTFKDLW